MEQTQRSQTQVRSVNIRVGSPFCGMEIGVHSNTEHVCSATPFPFST